MQSWPTSKKIDLILIILGFSALFLGLLNIKSTLVSSFQKGFNWNNVIASSEQKSASPSTALQKIIELKNKDTDHDGLSDYDEINIYHTNPYLKDTDGDGIPDGQEVKDGTNPNCPQGQNCGSFKTSPLNRKASTTKQEVSKFFSVNSPSSSFTKNSSFEKNTSSSLSTNEAARLMSGKASLAEVKQMLLQAGMSPQDLNKIPDKSIMQMYYQMVKEYQQKHSLNLNNE